MQIRAYIFVTLDLNKLNYDVWRELFETLCLSFGVLGHIDGSSTPTPMSEKRWKERDGLVKMWIYGTITDSLLDTIIKVGCTARDLWLSLESLFRDDKEARAFQFETELRTMTMEDLSVHEYCQKLKSLSDLLTNVDSPISDRVLVMHLLNGLTEKYDYILNVIKHKSPFPSFTEARSMLLMEESRLSNKSKSSLSHTNHPSLSNVLFTVPRQQERYPQEYHNNNSNMGRGRSKKKIAEVVVVTVDITIIIIGDSTSPQLGFTVLLNRLICILTVDHNFSIRKRTSRNNHQFICQSHHTSRHQPVYLSHTIRYLHGDARVNYISTSMADQSTFMPSHFPQTYSSMSLSDPPEEMW